MSKRAASNKKPGRHVAAVSRQGTGPQRLQRILASAGFGSRRQCEELIQEGRVAVDGQIVTKLGSTADPQRSEITVDDNSIRPERHVYYAVNKPTGVVTTNRDPQGRPRVIDLVPPDERVFPVGRLDRSSEGLILLTNDGDLAQRLAHPKFGVRKVYRVTVAGKVDGETMKQMRKGIYIAEGMVRVEGAKILKSRPRATELEIILREGKNREIRRILARLGHKVQTLRRIAIGPLKLGDVPPGAYRALKREEVRKLQRVTEEEEKNSVSQGGSRRNPNRGKSKKSVHQRNAKPSSAKKKSARKKSPPARLVSSQSVRTGAIIGGDSVESNESTSKPKTKSKTSTKRRNTKRGNLKRSAQSGRQRSGQTRGRSAKSASPRRNRKR